MNNWSNLTFTNKIIGKDNYTIVYQLNPLKLISITKHNKQVIFQEGPPFMSNNNFHSGTALMSFVKSTYQTYYQLNNIGINFTTGSDCHGVPTENYAMKQLKITTKDINNYGIDNFNNYCQNSILQYEQDWYNTFLLLGRHVNHTEHYRTMNKSYMDSVIWAFCELYKKDLIYQGSKILPYSYSLESCLSNFEANENYQKINTQSIYVKFHLKENTYILVWTTTPWTLTSNICICYNKNIQYVKFLDKNNNYIIASKSYCDNKKITNYELIDIINLRQQTYKPLFEYFNSRKFFGLYHDNFVTDDINTTGFVHISPFFGESDFNVCIKNNILTSQEIYKLCPIDESGKFKDHIEEFKNKLVFDCNKIICKKEFVYEIKQINHEYPYCPRTTTPLIYKVCEGYFVNIQKLKKQILEINNKITWKPSYLNEMFIKWIENGNDWCISRTRFFGTPIPIWKSKNGNILVVDDIKKYTNSDNYHSTNIKFFKHNDILYERVNFVLDCWFESGCSPFAQFNYPFKNKNIFDDKEYLSDFAFEGKDQYNHWYYTMIVLSTALFNKPPVKTLMCSGIILDKSGKKLSKSKGNYKDPKEIIKLFGTDAYRLYLLQSPVVNGEDLNFNEDKIKICNQKLIQLMNSIKFFKEYQILINGTNKIYSELIDYDNLNWIDKYILNELYVLKLTIDNNFKNYELRKSIIEINKFIDILTNFYIKIKRDDFKGINGISIQNNSLDVLHYIIKIFIIIACPFMPYTCENIYMQYFNKKQSIFLDNINDINIEFMKNNQNEENVKLFNNILKDVRIERTKNKQFSSNRKPINFIKISYNKKYKDFMENQQTIKYLINELNILNYEFVIDDIDTYNIYYNFEIDAELENEYFHQQIIRHIQQKRKDMKLHQHDNITIEVLLKYDANINIDKISNKIMKKTNILNKIMNNYEFKILNLNDQLINNINIIINSI